MTPKLMISIGNVFDYEVSDDFANGDMVGHTGSMQAAIKACEAVDQCVEKVVQSALKNEYTTKINSFQP